MTGANELLIEKEEVDMIKDAYFGGLKNSADERRKRMAIKPSDKYK